MASPPLLLLAAEEHDVRESEAIMATTALPERFSSQGLPMIIIGVASGGLVAWGLRLVNFPAEPASVLASGATVLPPAIANAIFKRRRGLRTEIAALSRGELIRPVGLVVAMIAGAQFFVTQMLAFIVGVCVGIGASVGGAATNAELFAAYNVAAVLTVYPLSLVTAFLIGRRAGHYLLRKPYLWTLAAVALFAVLQTTLDAIIVGSLPDMTATAVNLMFYAATYGAMALGAWRGLRHHQAYIAARLLRKLSAPDLAAIAEMVRESIDRGSSPSAPSRPDRRR